MPAPAIHVKAGDDPASTPQRRNKEVALALHVADGLEVDREGFDAAMETRVLDTIVSPVAAALAAEVPTRANGGVSSDLTSVTWKLKKDVKWSDGSPFTSAAKSCPRNRSRCGWSGTHCP